MNSTGRKDAFKRDQIVLTRESRMIIVEKYAINDRGGTYAKTDPATGSRVNGALQREMLWKAVGATQAIAPKSTAEGTRWIRTEGT